MSTLKWKRSTFEHTAGKSTRYVVSQVCGDTNEWILEIFERTFSAAYRRPGYFDTAEQAERMAEDHARDNGCLRLERVPVQNRDDMAYWRAR